MPSYREYSKDKHNHQPAQGSNCVVKQKGPPKKIRPRELPKSLSGIPSQNFAHCFHDRMTPQVSPETHPSITEFNLEPAPVRRAQTSNDVGLISAPVRSMGRSQVRTTVTMPYNPSANHPNAYTPEAGAYIAPELIHETQSTRPMAPFGFPAYDLLGYSASFHFGPTHMSLENDPGYGQPMQMGQHTYEHGYPALAFNGQSQNPVANVSYIEDFERSVDYGYAVMPNGYGNLSGPGSGTSFMYMDHPLDVSGHVTIYPTSSGFSTEASDATAYLGYFDNGMRSALY